MLVFTAVQCPSSSVTSDNDSASESFLSVFVVDHARVLISVLFKAGAVVLERRRAVDVITALMVCEVARMSCSC